MGMGGGLERVKAKHVCRWVHTHENVAFSCGNGIQKLRIPWKAPMKKNGSSGGGAKNLFNPSSNTRWLI